MEKIIQYLLLFLFFSLGIVHAHLLSVFGFDFALGVRGSFEFTKSQFFIFVSAIIFFLFSLCSFQKKHTLIFPKPLWWMLLILVLSTLFSVSPYTAFFGGNTKGHGALMFLTLLGIYIVILQQQKDFMKRLFIASVCGAICVSVIGIKEYFLPHFDYGNLSNRAIGTFGHPNYLALYLLILLPFVFEKSKNNKLLIIPLILFSVVIVLSKSAWGILIMLCYYLYLGIKRVAIKRSYLWLIICGALLIIGMLMYNFGLYTKLHSFLSRIYIWETMLQVFLNYPKILLVGSGLETLPAYFELHKSPALYIFENAGFTADRPHNFIINILFHFGIIGGILCVWSLHYLWKSYKNNYIFHSFIIFFLFCIFNFASVATYLLIILISSCISDQKHNYKYSIAIPLMFFILAGVGVWSSTNYYNSELLAKQGNYTEAIKVFPYNYKNYEALGDLENTLKYAGYRTNNSFRYYTDDALSCDVYTLHRGTAENYFYCGDMLWNLGEETAAKKFYKLGIGQIPDLWNKNSSYHDNFFVSHFVDGKRFFSDRYWKLERVLDRVGIENTFTNK